MREDSSKVAKEINTQADSLRHEIIQFLREIIAIPSLTGEEGPIIERLKSEMEKIGYDEVRVDPLGNLLGRMGDGENVIAFDGHCDTVDIGNPDLWEVDPFKGDFRDGIVFGRGASDQKGGLAAAIYAGKLLRTIGLPENITLWVVASVLEEDLEGLCWQYIVKEDKIKPDAVILTEPSSLTIAYGQRGRMEIEVRTDGMSCHGSAPERGINAIYIMAPIIQEIEALNSRLPAAPPFGKGSITITDIRSTAPSLCAVADSAAIHLDRRLTQGETEESALEEIKSLLTVKTTEAKVSLLEYKRKSYTGLIYPTRAYFPLWIMEKSHPLIKTAMDAYYAQFLKQPVVDKWIFSTNGVATKGMFDIPTIGFGPGNEVHAHSPTDQIQVEDLVKALAFYASLVWHWGAK
jgi:putative selenium metabolism hydrolase